MLQGENGPYFFEILTYRWKEHVGPNEDYKLGYRNYAEAEPWIRNDPVHQIAQRLEPETRIAIESNIDAEIRDAFDFAEKSPFPESIELYTGLFKD